MGWPRTDVTWKSVTSLGEVEKSKMALLKRRKCVWQVIKCIVVRCSFEEVAEVEN